MHQIGEYAVVGVLGEGGMSTVYEAEAQESKQRVALKVLEPGIAGSPRVRELFLGEMAILDRINHPHVVRLLESFEIDGRLVMVLELLRGETLRDTLRRCHRLAWPETIKLLGQILSGLSAAHSQQPPVVHRDLKPENVMITADGTVKVMDFGIAKVLREGTRATTDVGTLAYMCPEQIEGAPIDHRADLYNVGLLLYEMLAGAPPFRSQSTRELLNAQCIDPPPPLQPAVAQSVPASLVGLMLQLLAKSPHERPSSAEEVLQRLDAIVLSPGPSAMSMGPSPSASWTDSAVVSPTSSGGIGPTSWESVPRRTTGISAIAIAGSVAAVLMIAAIIGGLIFARQAKERIAEARSGSESGSRPGPGGDAAGTFERRGKAPRISGVACSVPGRVSGVEDIIALEGDPPALELAWLDGSTGETHRRLELEENDVHCVAPHALGVFREDSSVLDFIDVEKGEVLATAELETQFVMMTRVDATLKVIRSGPDDELDVPIPGCEARDCQAPHQLVPFTKVRSVGMGPVGSPMCALWEQGFEHGGVRYALKGVGGRLEVTATRDGDPLWSTLVEMKVREFLGCAITVSDDRVALVRADQTKGKLEILQLAAADGELLSRTTLAEAKRSGSLFVSAFFHNGKHFLVYVGGGLFAIDPASGEVAWRR
jgi:eukaryotic-like serine/threonine-protein kinase